MSKLSSYMSGVSDKMRRTVEEKLVSGESVVMPARIHPAIYWKSVAVLVLALLVWGFIAHELGVFLVIVALVMALHATILRSILMLVLTNKRILARYGILQVDVVDIHFDKVESIELERMLPGYLFGYSNVVLMGTGQRMIVIPYVSNGTQLRKAYNEIVLGDKN